MTYYTKNGKKIWKPTAYAKTGAPMYKTKYNDSTNINVPTSIYKLNLKNNKKYIGKTANLDSRMKQHFSGNGSQVTKKFKPIRGEVPGYFSNKAEQKYTEKYISKCGYENVRGGSYTNSTTLNY
jgi:predicted GIY-YIG superfamily endonuclease